MKGKDEKFMYTTHPVILNKKYIGRLRLLAESFNIVGLYQPIKIL